MLKQVNLTIMIVSFNYQVFLTSWCWFSVHTLNKFIRRKVVLEYFPNYSTLNTNSSGITCCFIKLNRQRGHFGLQLKNFKGSSKEFFIRSLSTPINILNYFRKTFARSFGIFFLSLSLAQDFCIATQKSSSTFLWQTGL